ncbi:hypothetical protein AAFC00_001986 [Neodothiora populina]|uniref:Carboxylic ester hydrolase n=1 Tax=Neodothiora populina TaxID=2781224 RepID=A0ABR3PG52_9PEZI
MTINVNVTLPTSTVPIREQTVVGKASSIPGLREFRGIPYGLAQARWEPSTVRTSLPTDVFDATRNGPRCPQPAAFLSSAVFQSNLDFPDDVETDELECLNLFIVAPGNISPGQKLPVYVFLHGGGLAFGAGSDPMWDPSRLVAASVSSGKPIIAVNVNYRLNIFGYGCPPATGTNFHIRDQHVALEWIHTNIIHFGGDPDRVTIGGESAGSFSVHSHVIDAKFGSVPHLFRRAIMESAAVGTAGPISLDVAAKRFAKLREHFDGADVETLKEIPAAQLLQANSELGWNTEPFVEDGSSIRRAPVGQGRWKFDLSSPTAKIEKSAVDIEKKKEPLVILHGYNDTEAALWGFMLSRIGSFDQLKEFMQSYIPTNLFDDFCRVYGIASSSTLPVIHEAITLFLTDIVFGVPHHVAQSELSATNAAGPDACQTTTQIFHVKYGNPWPGPSQDKAHHLVELIYIFDCFHEDLQKADAAETSTSVSNVALVEKMQKVWLDFIADDEPIQRREDQALVFGKDRVARVVDLLEEDEFIKNKQRHEFLLKDADVFTAAAHAINGMSFD